jgi:Yip1 domain
MSDPNQQWVPPPPPSPIAETPDASGPEMSTPATLTGIFFEPGRVFESFRRKPRFLVAGLIIILLVVVFNIAFVQRIGYDNIVREQIDSSPRAANMSAEQREQAIAMASNPIFKVLSYVGPVFFFVAFFALGGLLYMLGSMAMAKSLKYSQALAVWIYSSFPPILLTMILNLILLFIKSPDDISVAQSSRGLVHANLSLLVDATTAPVLATALGVIDIFAIYGLILAALGIRKTAKMSAGSAWGVVIAIWVIGVILRIAIAAIRGVAMA